MKILVERQPFCQNRFFKFFSSLFGLINYEAEDIIMAFQTLTINIAQRIFLG